MPIHSRQVDVADSVMNRLERLAAPRARRL